MINHLSRGLMVEVHSNSAPGLFERFRRHYVARTARHQLYALDDRMLHDIGISRGDIDHVTKR